MSGWTRVAAVGDLEPETALRVEIGNLPICLVSSAGRWFAIEDVCSHADVALSEGDVEGGTIECWLHGSRFELSTGQPTGLPATVAVATFPVRTDGDDVFVDAS